LDFENLSFKEIRTGLAEEKWTCQDLVQHSLDKIDEGTHLNAFISVLGARAGRKAIEIDKKLRRGQAGRLAGHVLAVKDNIAVKGEKLTCGSHILSNFVSPYNATVVRKLEAEDAIIIGKTNMDEFAMGSSTENSFFGPAKNPKNPDSVTGGSSGGSCAAVSAGMVTAALGSDTGGSIRQPASFCGVVGLKPTYGRVSRFGLVAFASSFDQIGPIGRSVSEVADLLKVISGPDRRDSTVASLDVPQFLDQLKGDVRDLRIGLPAEYYTDALNSEVREAVEKAIDRLQQNGAVVKRVSLPHTEYAIAAYYILATAEASSNLARYDGSRYGFRAEDAKGLQETYIESRSLGFGDEVKRRIMLGTYVLSAGYYDAYYRKGQKARTSILQDFQRAFGECDCLITPTAPTTAFKIGEKLEDPLSMYLSDVYTVSVNLAGLPALSIPCGRDSQGLPIGVQLIGNHFEEGTILRVADFFERSAA
jgi:aspartyl-tRNA(Asn)/glutamyl-tRNA(Gln) amidotransferase subunit A